VGSRRASVIDSKATITNGDTAVVYCGYDNEFGYSCQVVRTLERMAGVEWRIYPEEG
jgi:glyceraldehyde 3-phosphate dehydrogenase